MGFNNPPVVKDFNINKYLGRWYEIARIDYRYEKGLDNVTAVYSLRKDGLVRVDNKGFDTKKRKWRESIGKAKFRGSKTEGSLKVSFFLFFYAGYNIVFLDDHYLYALVAGDSEKYLWILSREKTIPATIRTKFLEHAEKLGYETNKLIWVEQG